MGAVGLSHRWCLKKEAGVTKTPAVGSMSRVIQSRPLRVAVGSGQPPISTGKSWKEVSVLVTDAPPGFKVSVPCAGLTEEHPGIRGTQRPVLGCVARGALLPPCALWSGAGGGGEMLGGSAPPTTPVPQTGGRGGPWALALFLLVG